MNIKTFRQEATSALAGFLARSNWNLKTCFFFTGGAEENQVSPRKTLKARCELKANSARTWNRTYSGRRRALSHYFSAETGGPLEGARYRPFAGSGHMVTELIMLGHKFPKQRNTHVVKLASQCN